MTTQYHVNRVPDVVDTNPRPAVAEPKAEYGKSLPAPPAAAHR